MHLILEGPSLEHPECREWLRRVAWTCLPWFEFNPALAHYDRASGSFKMPIRRVKLTTSKGPSFLSIFLHLPPRKMTRLPAILVIGHVLDVLVVGREPAVDKWITVDFTMSSGRSTPGVIYIGRKPRSSHAASGLEVKVSALSIEIIDDAPKEATPV